VRNEEVQYYKGPRTRGISYKKLKKRKASWIGHILRNNCLIQHVIKGKIGEWTEVMEGRGRRRSKQLLDDLKEKRGYWKLQ